MTARILGPSEHPETRDRRRGRKTAAVGCSAFIVRRIASQPYGRRAGRQRARCTALASTCRVKWRSACTLTFRARCNKGLVPASLAAASRPAEPVARAVSESPYAGLHAARRVEPAIARDVLDTPANENISHSRVRLQRFGRARTGNAVGQGRVAEVLQYLRWRQVVCSPRRSRPRAGRSAFRRCGARAAAGGFGRTERAGGRPGVRSRDRRCCRLVLCRHWRRGQCAGGSLGGAAACRSGSSSGRQRKTRGH